jgi:hypothetical protein
MGHSPTPTQNTAGDGFPPIMPGQQSGRLVGETFKSLVPGGCTDAADDARGAVLQAAPLPAVTRNVSGC